MWACEHCQSHFSHQSSLSRHKRTCRVKLAAENAENAANNARLEGVISSLNETIREMKDSIDRNNSTPRVQNTTNNQVVSQNIQNITINQFGKEETTHLTGLDLDKLVYRTKLGLVQLMEYIHFQHEKGRNLNVRVSDMKHDVIEYYNGRRWMYGWKPDVLNRMVGKGLDLMTDHFDVGQERLRKKWSLSMYDHVEKWLDCMQEGNTDVFESAANDIYLMLCNNTTDIANEKNRLPRTRRKSI